jgi:cytochrome b6-f complex iron-sulfur subunit
MNLQSESTTSRRRFLQGSIFVLLTAFCASVINVVTRFLLPPPPEKRAYEFSIPMAQIPLGSSLIVKHRDTPVILIHTSEGISAFNATCTHLGCIVKWSGTDNVFYCPCHAAKFDSSGNVLSGPPSEPLHKIPIKISDDSILIT